VVLAKQTTALCRAASLRGQAAGGVQRRGLGTCEMTWDPFQLLQSHMQHTWACNTYLFSEFQALHTGVIQKKIWPIFQNCFLGFAFYFANLTLFVKFTGFV
jgi:hypothetical protein